MISIFLSELHRELEGCLVLSPFETTQEGTALMYLLEIVGGNEMMSLFLGSTVSHTEKSSDERGSEPSLGTYLLPEIS